MTGEGIYYDIGQTIAIFAFVGIPAIVVSYYIFKNRYKKKTTPQ